MNKMMVFLKLIKHYFLYLSVLLTLEKTLYLSILLTLEKPSFCSSCIVMTISQGDNIITEHYEQNDGFSKVNKTLFFIFECFINFRKNIIFEYFINFRKTIILFIMYSNDNITG